MINEQVKAKAEESDEELFTVPDVEDTKNSNNSNNNNNNNNNNGTYTSSNLQQAAGSNDINEENNINNNNGANVNASSPAGGDPPPKRKRGRNPVDKEYRRLKRLLRNRVSAQQARERKKVYVNDMEARAHELQDQNLKLEEKISTLVNENTMLRKILMNTRPKVDDNVEAKA